MLQINTNYVFDQMYQTHSGYLQILTQALNIFIYQRQEQNRLCSLQSCAYHQMMIITLQVILNCPL